MRHKRAGKKLGRSTNARRALFANLLTTFFENERITTTQAKAEAIKGKIDNLINKAKKGDLVSRRSIYAFLKTPRSAQKLIKEIAPRYTKRKNGYARFVRLGSRRGDRAMMVKLELIGGKKKTEGKRAEKAENREEAPKKETKAKRKV